MDDKTRDVIQAVEKLAEPVLRDMGLELVEVQYRREQGGWTLRLFIDRPPDAEPSGGNPPQAAPHNSGVTLDDCVEASREIGGIIDLNEVIPGTYNLEVSSPGLDRPLKKPADFFRFNGEKVKVALKNPVNGRRNLKGRLTGFQDGVIHLELDKGAFKINFNDTERVTIEPEF